MSQCLALANIYWVYRSGTAGGPIIHFSDSCTEFRSIFEPQVSPIDSVFFVFLMIIEAFYLKIEIINDGSTEVVRDINAFNACPRLDWTLIEPWKTEISIDFTMVFWSISPKNCTMKTHRKAGRTGRLPHPYGKAVLVAHGLLPQWIGWVGAPWFLPRESITYIHYNTIQIQYTYTYKYKYKYNTIHTSYIHVYIYIYIFIIL